MDEEHPLPDEMGVVDGEEIVFEEGQFAYEYDSTFNLSQERNLLFELYQPVESQNGTFLCKICLRTGKEMEFNDRNGFVAHRYKCHGSYNNTIICPVVTCREVFASMGMIRRHLNMAHNLPCEVHQQAFANVGEFEKWRHLVELSSGCRYMMHTKQPKLRRQIMHCAKSEHKLILQTNKHRLPRVRMAKEGACCPAHISFRVDGKTGEVHCFCQLYHVGHAENGFEEPSTSADLDGFRPIDMHFPMKPKYYGERPMQFVQVDTVEMTTAIYGSTVYENVLIVTDIKSGFLWARPLSEISRPVITRLLASIFSEYGVPEGFSTCFGLTFVRDSMKTIENVYGAEIREVWNEPIAYDDLEQWLLLSAHDELGSANRWVEQLQFIVMEYNQKMRVESMTPFERMFNRKPRKLFDDIDEEDGTTDGKIKYDPAIRLMQRDVLSDGIEQLPIAYQVGERVYLRRVLKKPARGNNTVHLFGFIAEVDECSIQYPYKVHYSSTDNPWPSEANIYAWASTYDVLPTTHRLRTIGEGERQKVLENLFCVCSGIESSKMDVDSMPPFAKTISRCVLYRNIMCTNRMSRVCCKNEGVLPCVYHEIYPESDDSYSKLEMTLVTYNKMLKEEAAASALAIEVAEAEEAQRREIIMGSEGFEGRCFVLKKHLQSEILVKLSKAERQFSSVETPILSPSLPPPDRVVHEHQHQQHQQLQQQNHQRKRKNNRDVDKDVKEPIEKSQKVEEPATTSEPIKAPSPTPSVASSVRSVSPTRRQSSRRSVRPKNLSDYVA